MILPLTPELYLALATPVFLLVALMASGAARRDRARRGIDGAEPDWSVPAVDAYADRTSFFHAWDPGVKVGALFLFCFLVASLQSLLWSGAAFLVAAVAVLVSRVPLYRPLRRLAAMAGFLFMLLVILPFSGQVRGDESLLLLPGLEAFPFRLKGFVLAVTIGLKACAIGLMMEPMLGTSPLSATLRGLSRVGLPPALIQLLVLTHRYLFVFREEARRMYRAMRVRGFAPGTNMATLHTLATFLGMLFVSSFERTHRVYDAMLGRGYRGSFPIRADDPITRWDLAKGCGWIMIGVLLLALDRLCAVTWG